MIAERLLQIKQQLPDGVDLVAVSKFHSVPSITEAYNAGQRIFGESRVQELCGKVEELPDDIEWHFIGPLQRNKVKYIVPFVSLIQSVDSERLFLEIFKQAVKCQRSVSCLLEVKIASEEAKGGWSFDELFDFVERYMQEPTWQQFVPLRGLMGMATLTNSKEQVKREFASLRSCFEQLRNTYPDWPLKTLSMGMSDDWPWAIEEGANAVRIGTAIFGEREY